MNNALLQQIMRAAQRAGSDPYTLAATAIVESGLNPNAVGDNGTSFGLFQMHAGGAGGRTVADAKRYLDPRASIQNRAGAFRGGSGGAWAASVQRPANQAAYAQKVDQVIQQLKNGNINLPNVPAGGGGGGAAPSGGANPKQFALGLIFEDDPELAGLMQRAAAAQESPVASPSSAVDPSGMGGGSLAKLPRKPGEPAWQYLQRLGQSMFGLQNDPGDHQTTGGKHTQNSYHYKGRAIDFGSARNDWGKLNAWYSFLDRNRSQLGIRELLNEGDHIHAAI